jgi:ankyrin repeat protein
VIYTTSHMLALASRISLLAWCAFIAAVLSLSACKQGDSYQELIDAIESNDLDGVQRAIRRRADVNRGVTVEYGGFVAPNGFETPVFIVEDVTPLHRAANHSSIEINDLLLKVGADPRATDGDGDTPLSAAAGHGRTAIVRRLLQAGADPNTTNMYGSTPLHAAAQSGDAATVRALLEAGANVHVKVEDAFEPLHDAANEGHAHIVRMLLEAGADVHRPGPQNFLAIHMAGLGQSVEVIDILLEHGADINAVAGDGTTPLIAAAIGTFDNVTALQRVLDAGAEVEHAGGYALLYSAKHAGAVQLFLERNVDPNFRDDEGRTPLMFAAMYGNLRSAGLLVQAGADADARDHSGGNALMHLRGNPDPGLVDLLLEAGADVHAVDAEGRTVLEHVTQHSEPPLTGPALHRLRQSAAARPNR